MVKSTTLNVQFRLQNCSHIHCPQANPSKCSLCNHLVLSITNWHWDLEIWRIRQMAAAECGQIQWQDDPASSSLMFDGCNRRSSIWLWSILEFQVCFNLIIFIYSLARLICNIYFADWLQKNILLLFLKRLPFLKEFLSLHHMWSEPLPFGRKPSILVGRAAFLAGSALGGAAINIYMLIFGRVLLGIGVGFTNQVAYNNINQNLHLFCCTVSAVIHLWNGASQTQRSIEYIGFEVGVGFGVLVKIEGGWGWRISLAMASIPASIVTLTTLFLPETPNSLIQQNINHHHQKAKKVLQHHWCPTRTRWSHHSKLNNVKKHGTPI